MERKTISVFFFCSKTILLVRKKEKITHKKKKNRINLLNLISFGGEKKSPKLAAIRRGGGRGGVEGEGHQTATCVCLLLRREAGTCYQGRAGLQVPLLLLLLLVVAEAFLVCEEIRRVVA